MYKTAFLFNGIGSPPKKLTSALPSELYDKYLYYFDSAFSNLGLNKDIEKNNVCDKRIAEWLVSLLCDRVVYEYYISKGIIPDIGAGCSMGIVSISACFGAFSHDFAHRLVMTNRFAMNRFSNEGLDMDLGIVIGFSYDEISPLLKKHFSEIDLIIGSGNSSFHVLLSGKADAIERAFEICLKEGALKTFRFYAGTAFHHPLMLDYSSEYTDFCESILYDPPVYPILSVFNRKILTSPEDVIKENQLNVYTPIRWDLALNKLEELGVTDFFDVSSNGAVKKFSRVSRKCTIHTFNELL